MPAKNIFILLKIQLGDYMIRLRAIGPCTVRRIEQFAILSYATVEEASDIDLCISHLMFPSYEDNFYAGVVSIIDLR